MRRRNRKCEMPSCSSFNLIVRCEWLYFFLSLPSISKASKYYRVHFTRLNECGAFVISSVYRTCARVCMFVLSSKKKKKLFDNIFFSRFSKRKCRKLHFCDKVSVCQMSYEDWCIRLIRFIVKFNRIFQINYIAIDCYESIWHVNCSLIRYFSIVNSPEWIACIQSIANSLFVCIHSVWQFWFYFGFPMDWN